MTNKRSKNRSQNAINDTQEIINKEQSIINDKTKIDLSVSGFWGILVIFAGLLISGSAIYYGLTNQVSRLSDNVDSLKAMIVEQQVSNHAQLGALNRMETRVTILERDMVYLGDGSAQLKVQ